MYVSQLFIDVINTTKKWLTRQIRLIYSSTCVTCKCPERGWWLRLAQLESKVGALGNLVFMMKKFNGLDVWKLSVGSKCSISLRIESAGLSVLEK